MSTPGRVPPTGCMPPTGEPLVGRVVRLDVMRAEDAPGLFEVYGDPRCYEHG